MRVGASLKMRVAGQSGHRIKGLFAKNLHIYDILVEKSLIRNIFLFLTFSVQISYFLANFFKKISKILLFFCIFFLAGWGAGCGSVRVGKNPCDSAGLRVRVRLGPIPI